MTDAKILAARTTYITRSLEVDALTLLSELFCGFVVRDRFGLLNEDSCFNLSNRADPIPVADSSLLIGDCFDASATQIANQYEKVVAVWNGGILSSAVVVALVKACGADRLTVACTQEAVDRHVALHDKLVEGSVFIQIFDSDTALWSALGEIDADVIVTNDCGREVLGLPVVREVRPYIDEPFITGLATAWSKCFSVSIANDSLSVLQAKIEFYATHLGLTVSTLADVLLLFNFGCLYEHKRYASKLRLHGTKNQNKTVAFFDTELFGQYFVSSFAGIKELGYRKFVSQATRLVRHYVVEYTNDSLYYYESKSYGKKESAYKQKIRILLDNGKVQTYSLSTGTDLRALSGAVLDKVKK